MKRLFTKRKSAQPTSPVVPITKPGPLPYTRPVSLQPKFVVPAVPHPCPYASISLLVTPDGLLLRPDIQGLTHATSHVKISWGVNAAVEGFEGDTANWTASATVHGIVGILRLFHASYLMVITSRSKIGDLFDDSRTVYRVDGVSAIPLEETRATSVVNMLASRRTTATTIVPPISPSVQESTENSDTSHMAGDGPDSQDTPALRVTFAPVEPKQAIMEPELDVSVGPSPNSSGSSTPITRPSTSPIAKALAVQLSFWNRLAKRAPDSSITPLGLNSPSTETIDSLERHMESGAGPSEVLDPIIASTVVAPSTTEERHAELDEKIVRETIKEFVKGGMYFSYNFDITTSLQRKQQQVAKLKRQSSLLQDLEALDEQPRISLSSEEVDVFSEPHPTLPLWRRADKKFWWNESLLRSFIDAGLHSYVLPIMQGYYQIASFRIPLPTPVTTPSRAEMESTEGNFTQDQTELHDSQSVDYILVSRRSRDRAGLRYQRRGIDDEANVANFVETETIMRIDREGRSNTFSYTQIRGSIPLFWTQPGYGLKPPPQLSTERTHTQVMDALKRHFTRTTNVYGPLAIVNLAEQHGKEGAITTAYRDSMQEWNSSDAQYHEYDFHAETKGMRYENISNLIMQMERFFESQGFFWVSDGVIMSQQKGAFRVNCIDCLDRTNVVQSAFARFVMQTQLEAVAVHNVHEIGDRSDVDVVFNDVWANNGDAISRAYAGTSALKGDFTRTGKRDLGGLFNDGLNSLSRVYSSTFSDWFSQAVIDYFLGYRTLSVFSEFLLKLSSTDPRELIRISKVRAAAIETCSSRVLFEGERQIAGWTLFSPVQMNVKLADKFEEKVLLLTAKALYMVSYDYSLEKVKLFTRIPLGDIVGIMKGLYILSPLEEASRLPDDNYGFIISYLPSRLTTRVSSYSVRNSIGSVPSSPSSPTTRFENTPRSPSKTTGHRSSGSISKASTFAGSKSATYQKGVSTTLSRLLSNVTGNGGTVLTAAFKALPVESVRGDTEAAKTCRGAVDTIVERVRKASSDLGNAAVVSEGDIVSLAEAQKMATVFSKLEYNLKRLLWLGS